jgi:hypothetical protein
VARRRSKTSATGGNLDSMLDTLTNVVGILVIVLVTVQLSSQEAASRIAATATKVAPEELARLERAAAAAREAAAAAAAALAREQAAAKNPQAEVARLETEATAAERRAREAADKAAAAQKKRTQDVEKAQQAAATAAKAAAAEAAKRQTDHAKAAAVVKELQTRLASLPLPVAPPAKQVRLPDPRPAPKDAKELRVLCRDGRVWVVDIPSLQEPAKKRADYVVKRKKLDPDGDAWLTDGKTFVEEFNESPVREDGFEMTLMISGGKWPQLVLTRMPGSGQTAAEATRGTSPLARTLRRLGSDDHYVRFYVWPDGFEAYLEVRDFVAERGFAAGWEPVTGKDEHRISLGRYAIGTKPPPGTTSTPKPVEHVLD